MSARLSPNQALVLEALRRADGPRGAYQILEGLRGAGINAPVQVYRALEGLEKRGLAHRIETLNAYIACDHDHGNGPGAAPTVFAICEDCGAVAEFDWPDAADSLNVGAARAGFSPREMSIELKGRCRACRD